MLKSFEFETDLSVLYIFVYVGWMKVTKKF